LKHEGPPLLIRYAVQIGRDALRDPVLLWDKWACRLGCPQGGAKLARTVRPLLAFFDEILPCLGRDGEDSDAVTWQSLKIEE
jgi:hypothetical protein